ncbi:MAG: DUF2029 domain-containing protein [Deltaproteobacteria bacterium]|nr:DUF2029 domain-containing protein [Deltaproteobacteria bacterium]
MDFKVYHYTAQAFLSGNMDIYNVAYQPNFYFKYAPMWGLFFMPFGFFSLQTGSIIYELLNLILVIANLHIIGLILKYYKIIFHPILYVIGMLVLSNVIVSDIMQGQQNFLVSYLVLLALYAYLKKQWYAFSALLLSSAVSLKLPALIFLFFFLKKRDIRMLLWILIFFISTNVISAALLNPAQPFKLFLDWFNVLFTSNSLLLFNDGTRSVFTLFGRYLSDITRFHLNFLSLSKFTVKGLAMILGFMMTLISLFPLFRSKRENLGKEELVTLSTLMILMVLFNPSVWSVNYSSLLFPVIYALILSRYILLKPAYSSFYLLFSLLICNWFMHKKAWALLGMKVFQGTSELDSVFLPLPIFGILLYIFLIKAFKDCLLLSKT